MAESKRLADVPRTSPMMDAVDQTYPRREANVPLRIALTALAAIAIPGLTYQVIKETRPVAAESITPDIAAALVDLSKEGEEACTGQLPEDVKKDVVRGCSNTLSGRRECVGSISNDLKVDRFVDWVENERQSAIDALGLVDESWHKCDPSVPNPVRGRLIVSERGAILSGYLSPDWVLTHYDGSSATFTSENMLHNPVDYVVILPDRTENLVAGQSPEENR